MVEITKKGKKVSVTFTVPIEKSECIELMGDWNNWTPEVMERTDDGGFYLRKVLDADTEYQFGYYNDGEWLIEETLDTVESHYGSYNSVLVL